MASERGTELNEGLAAYIHQLALGRTTIEVPSNELAAGAVRLRVYTIGRAIAFLLDRIRPDWKAPLEAHDRQALDEGLAGALVGAVESPMGGCALPTDVRRIEIAAHRDAADVVNRRTTRRRAFDARGGWRVGMMAAFLALGNDACQVRAIDENGVDIDAFTDGFGRTRSSTARAVR